MMNEFYNFAAGVIGVIAIFCLAVSFIATDGMLFMSGFGLLVVAVCLIGLSNQGRPRDVRWDD